MLNFPSSQIDYRIEQVLISEEEIKTAINNVVEWIEQNYNGQDLVLVTILKGSIPFIGQLMTKIKIDFEIEYLCVSSFKGKTSAVCHPEILNGSLSKTSLRDKHILLIEDIVDSGRTIKTVMNVINECECKSCKLVTLLDKPGGRQVELKPDYACFTIENHFVVGFGLDYQEKLRNLPYVGILKKEYYEK